jgi:hypothetical protein
MFRQIMVSFMAELSQRVPEAHDRGPNGRRSGSFPIRPNPFRPDPEQPPRHVVVYIWPLGIAGLPKGQQFISKEN